MKMIRNIPSIKFTKEGLEKILKEKEELLKKRVGTVERLTRAREMGDLSENGAYHAAKGELRDIDRRLRQIEYLRKNAEVTSPPASGGLIGIGSKVKINNGKDVIEYSIVGDFEANPVLRKISGNSPIGAALLGRKKGDKVIVNLEAGKLELEILEVTS